MTTRETLTRYRAGLVSMDVNADGEWVRFADVEARDQAREAAIRELIAKLAKRAEALALTGDFADAVAAEMLNYCIGQFESLLTPTQEREQK